MIYTLTLNPAIDRELTVSTIELDSVMRASGQRVDLGGKGLNVSRMVKQLGGQSVALGFVGGNAGEMLDAGLSASGIDTDFVWVANETRTNFSLIESTGSHHLKVNESGAIVSLAEQSALVEKLLGKIKSGDWCVLSGSLPPGVPTNFYAEIVKEINQRGANTILDASGDPLRLGCEASPCLVAPNLSEASELTGQTDPLKGALALRARGATDVIVTLGSAGALLVNDQGTRSVVPPTIQQRNPIGAGDALVGGVVYGLKMGVSIREALCWGVACGTIAASLDGTKFGDRATVETMLSQLTIRDSPAT